MLHILWMSHIHHAFEAFTAANIKIALICFRGLIVIYRRSFILPIVSSDTCSLRLRLNFVQRTDSTSNWHRSKSDSKWIVRFNDFAIWVQSDAICCCATRNIVESYSLKPWNVAKIESNSPKSLLRDNSIFPHQKVCLEVAQRSAEVL